MAEPVIKNQVKTTESTPQEADYVVEVKDLYLNFYTQVGVVRALNGVSFSIPRGKVLGIVGESGCGKSQTGLSILQLVPPPGRIEKGQILFKRNPDDEPIDILKLGRNSDEMRNIRGDDISMIFQEPMTSLNPVYTIGDQIMEAILLHQTPDKKEARRRAVDILRRVGMPNPERIADSYPHELSGGMRQRAMIALALSCTPVLLIADEPTTALDVTTEAVILDLMRELQAEIGTSIMFVTHNMGVVAQMCDEVAVMYLGRVVERAPVDDIFYNPKHPYTIALLRSIPRIGQKKRKRLEVIKGSVPDPYSTVTGCPFHPRCPNFMPGLCDKVLPAETPVNGDTKHTVRCHLYPGSVEVPSQASTHGGAAVAS
ncbi:oligopeptide/dipeptide ABC transporter, ATPase subunit [Thermobaculum terrenum ATCC BAA-798]|uniref:Oligopeptide/dipeptide ABC transporter, ATPase subunit n=1 Tax=Thermobaculum terrenum (strain ATCC BAA-798 / CCMEE 7001 / YNP1) TaxID=525904 RepID=D1CD43_THET1|nr:ABC transporter ATP-binding protein [Thermobaculum terrenum]ACZ42708.1 oligopeptide/dipeptide ABC transporter, ATPase subunit [Thermobaculum terrenum ATCC BAA-798]